MWTSLPPKTKHHEYTFINKIWDDLFLLWERKWTYICYALHSTHTRVTTGYLSISAAPRSRKQDHNIHSLPSKQNNYEIIRCKNICMFRNYCNYAEKSISNYLHYKKAYFSPIMIKVRRLVLFCLRTIYMRIQLLNLFSSWGCKAIDTLLLAHFVFWTLEDSECFVDRSRSG